MFDHRTYVPVLRWKQGERRAVQRLCLHDALRMHPLFEVPPPMSAGDRASASKPPIQIIEEVHECWGTRPAFFDASALAEDRAAGGGGTNPTKLFFQGAGNRGLRLIPVMTLQSTADYLSIIRQIVKQDERGVCLRLYPNEMSLETLPAKLDRALEYLAVEPAATDLVLDLGAVTSGDLALAERIGQVPIIGEWRTLTVAGGAFPPRLGNFPLGTNFLPRHDWLAWRDTVPASVARIPSFGDYAAVHPVLPDHRPYMNPTASIRFARTEAWLLMRGNGVLTDGAGEYLQFPANARLLRDLHGELGTPVCAGDRFIIDVMGSSRGPGNMSDWMFAAVNRHLTLTVLQIANHFET